MRPNRASATAILVATGVLYRSRSPDHPIPATPEAAALTEWLLRNYSPLTRCIYFCLGRRWFHWMMDRLESATIPGILEHYVRRKQAIAHMACEGLGSPAMTLTALGAGFDTLSLQLIRQMPGLHALEIDHPATQEWKRRGIAALGMERPELAFLPQDLSMAFPALPKIPRFWVAEGLLMYLEEDRVRSLFHAIHETSMPGSRIAFTFMERHANGQVDFRRPSGWVNLWLAQRREPFHWGISRGALEAFLTPLGFRRVEIPGGITRDMDRLDVGEFLALYEVIPR